LFRDPELFDYLRDVLLSPLVEDARQPEGVLAHDRRPTGPAGEVTLGRLFGRNGVNNRTQLVALATRQGWLSSSGGPTSTGTDPRARRS